VKEAIKTVQPRSLGLYRIRATGAPTLVYIGQGRIWNRLAAHVSKIRNLTLATA
jgi:hypothetical protein